MNKKVYINPYVAKNSSNGNTLKPELPDTQVKSPPVKKSIEHIELLLPSSNIFYDVASDFSIRVMPFSLRHIKGLHIADSSASFSKVVEVLNDTIENMDAEFLTVSDFWYLMYWQRLNAYKAHPMNVQFWCDSPNHVKDVADNKLGVDTLINHVIVNTNKFETSTITLDDKAITNINDFHEKYGIYLTVPTIGEMLRKTDDEDNWLSEYAVYVSDLNYENTLNSESEPEKHISIEDKIKFLEDFSEKQDSLDFMCDFDTVVLALNHGVNELVHITCKECRAKLTRMLSINALDFFPENFINRNPR